MLQSPMMWFIRSFRCFTAIALHFLCHADQIQAKEQQDAFLGGLSVGAICLRLACGPKEVAFARELGRSAPSTLITSDMGAYIATTVLYVLDPFDHDTTSAGEQW